MRIIHCYSGCFVGKNKVYILIHDAEKPYSQTLFNNKNNLSSRELFHP
jgi:hypothetical protein